MIASDLANTFLRFSISLLRFKIVLLRRILLGIMILSSVFIHTSCSFHINQNQSDVRGHSSCLHHIKGIISHPHQSDQTVSDLCYRDVKIQPHSVPRGPSSSDGRPHLKMAFGSHSLCTPAAIKAIFTCCRFAVSLPILRADRRRQFVFVPT